MQCKLAEMQKLQPDALRCQRNVRICAKVSPACRRFADTYELTPTVLGTGMNGDVVLARQRNSGLWTRSRVSTAGSEEELKASHKDSAASASSSTKAPQDDDENECPVEAADQVAVKTLTKKGLAVHELQRMRREVDIYLRMDHMNVARLLQVFDEPDRVYLVMEYCWGGTLLDRQRERGRFSEKEAACTMRQILSAVNYCHSHPGGKVCHGDLKHQNFVYASRAEGAPLKLVDFGLSQVLSAREPRSSLCAGSLLYSAPEILLHRKHDQSCDMWSLGVIAYSLLANDMPFSGASLSELTRSIAKGASALLTEEAWEDVSDEAKDFVLQLLTLDPSERPTAEVALHHSWFDLVAPLSTESAVSTQQATTPSSCKDVLEKVRLFAYESAARRASASLAAHSENMDMVLDDDSCSALEMHFRDLDTDMSGTISADEFAEALHQVLGVSPEESRFVFERLDTDGDGEIEYSEFLAAAMGTQLLHSDDMVRKAFEHLDVDNDGSIDVRGLPRVLGKRFCGQPSESIFSDIAKDGKRNLSLDSFEWMVKCKPMD